MRKIKYYSTTVFASFVGYMLIGFSGVAAQESVGQITKNLTLTGYGSYQSGQIVAGQWEGGDNMDHYWSHQVYAGIGFNAKLSDHMDLIAGVEGKMWNAYPNGGLFRNWIEQQMSLWLTEASGTYSFGDPEKPWLKFTGGYFPFKYNPEVRNLGEYMFRSYTYPGLLFNAFDFPAARLLGLKASFNFFEGIWKNDLMVLEQAETWPFGDISLAYIGSYNFAKIIDFSAGVDLANYISVNSNNTTPQVSANEVMMVDPTTNNKTPVVHTHQNADGILDTMYDYYTFKAIKPMARVTFDPKPFMGGFGELLGNEDLKLYGEIAVIGTQDYSYYYDNISKRMPIMLGFYFPTFKVFDMLNVEFEHYSCPFITSYYNQVTPVSTGSGSTVCLPIPTAMSSEDINAIAWKWSVYIKKTVTPGVAVTLQLARDHFRPNYDDGYPAYAEALVKLNQWQWILKLSGNI